MRQVELEARQFQYFAFPIVAMGNADNIEQFECQIRLVRKFKDPQLTEDVPLREEEQEEAAKANAPTYPSRRLSVGRDAAVFVLQDDEWKLLLKRLEGHRLKINAIAAEDLATVIEAVKQASHVKEPVQSDG
jgi:hypothetical protein